MAPHDPDDDTEIRPLPATAAGSNEDSSEDDEVLTGEVVSPSEDEARGDLARFGEDDDQAELSLDADPALGGELVEEDLDLDSEPTLVTRASDTALTRMDPLAAYMRDVQRYSLLSAEETHDLAVRYVTTGDVDAARKLVTSNLRLVVKIAHGYRQAHRNVLDLIQEGNIGLMQAVRKYDPYKGVKLSSYSAWWIRAYILRFILNNTRLVKLGTTQAQRKLFFNLKKEKARLSAMGIDPTPETIAKRLDVTTEEVIHMDRRLGAGDMSLDAPVGYDGSSTSRIELLEGAEQPADEALANEELHELLTDKIREFGRHLTGKEQIIFVERLMSDEPKTLQELGERFGVTRERVRQIEKRLQNKIRVYLEQHVEPSALG
jgi:RNA polymerase sigma-32 factor